ncbi:MAG: hypothetical protein R6W67_00410 [Bacteroidales bacterium]
MKRIKTLLISVIALLVFSQAGFGQDDIIFRRHLIKSGYHGLLYGIAGDIIFGIDGAAAVGLPVIVAGTSVLVPLLINSDKSIDFGPMILSGHGKSIGWAHGFALSSLIFGENTFSEDNYKISVGLGALSSIGGGILGKSLANRNDWSEGRVELYRHYGWVMPFTGFSAMLAATDDPRVAGAGVLLSGAAGYFAAGKISDWNNYTRGEVRATQTLSTLNMGLGYGYMLDKQGDGEFKRTDLLYPALGALSGTVIGHFYNRNLGFTTQQGLLTSYATAGGAVVGLGVALLTGSEKITPYYLIPYATGLGSYIAAVEILKRRGGGVYSLLEEKNRNNLQVSIMPQNLFINNRLGEKGFITNGRYTGMQPMFAASLTF